MARRRRNVNASMIKSLEKDRQFFILREVKIREWIEAEHERHLKAENRHNARMDELKALLQWTINRREEDESKINELRNSQEEDETRGDDSGEAPSGRQF
jgi:hypothetical protein